jgi:hypothetical protein
MNPRNRTIAACREAGLPVIDEHGCTCRLRGQLVVLARRGGLEVIWPYDRRCPIHDPRDMPAQAAGGQRRRRGTQTDSSRRRTPVSISRRM